MTFIREIGIDRITDKLIEDYESRGFKVIFKEDSVEIWAQSEPEEPKNV
jgi:hypothetical protein